ncbi:MAG TPA: phosphopantetheine-binding protein, partial [Herpetosiphonaceae bacterium]
WHPPGTPPLGSADLRPHVGARLPDYMVPSAFVLLDALPLLPNGKLDRSALPEPDTSRAAADQPYAAPRNPVERALAEIWSEVLGMQQIGIHDNFFALGGHSLMMTQVVARIRDRFKVDLPMPGFFQGPTIAELAVSIGQRSVAPSSEPDLVAAPVRKRDAPPAADTLERLLDQIERLSPSEIRAMLAARQRAESADSPPLHYRSAAITHVSVGDGLALVYTGAGAPRLIDADLAALLEHCREFKTLDDHTRAITDHLKQRGDRDALKRRLEDLRTARLLISDREAFERLIGAAPSQTTPAQIAAVAWPTCNRAALLERSLVSYIENGKRYGRSPEYVVMDDSPDAATQRDYRRRLALLRDRYDVPIVYAGPAEKAAFIKHLCRSGSLPPDVVEFAIFGDPRSAHRYGGNTNAILLHTVGDPIISSDDDTIGRVMPAPEPLGGLRMISGSSIDGAIHLHSGDPDEVWSYPSREALLRQATFVETDLLAIHERLLGHEIRRYAASIAEAGEPVDLRDVHPGLLERMQARGGEVLVTLPGITGDSGWGTPSHYLSFTGNSLLRLVRSEQTYRAVCLSRNLLRVARQTTITAKIAHLMGGSFGLDNRQIVPPMIPVAIGQDAVFGRTISTCYDRGYVAHLPWAILHLPGEERSFWPGEMMRSASGVSFQSVLSALLGTFDRPGSSASGADRLRQLGGYLEEIGSLPQAEFEAAIRSAVGQEAGVYLRMLDTQLQSGELPAYWTRDVRQFSAALRQSLVKEAFYIPLDLLYGRDIEEARRLTQEFVYRVGQLYSWWPEMVEQARSLRARQIRLAANV